MVVDRYPKMLNRYFYLAVPLSLVTSFEQLHTNRIYRRSMAARADFCPNDTRVVSFCTCTVQYLYSRGRSRIWVSVCLRHALVPLLLLPVSVYLLRKKLVCPTIARLSWPGRRSLSNFPKAFLSSLSCILSTSLALSLPQYISLSLPKFKFVKNKVLAIEAWKWSFHAFLEIWPTDKPTN